VPSCSVQPQHLLLVLNVLAYTPQTAFEFTDESSRHDEHTRKRTHSLQAFSITETGASTDGAKGGADVHARSRTLMHGHARSRTLTH
jgi:hypothetical protein